VADVYVLAQAQPLLFVYPSQVHPTTSTAGGRYRVHLPHIPDPDRRRRRDEDALVVLGAL
jgi:hypothetical protein